MRGKRRVERERERERERKRKREKEAAGSISVCEVERRERRSFVVVVVVVAVFDLFVCCRFWGRIEKTLCEELVVFIGKKTYWGSSIRITFAYHIFLV